MSALIKVLNTPHSVPEPPAGPEQNFISWSLVKFLTLAKANLTTQLRMEILKKYCGLCTCIEHRLIQKINASNLSRTPEKVFNALVKNGYRITEATKNSPLANHLEAVWNYQQAICGPEQVASGHARQNC